jgi:uncharacterized protein YpiB (UPF0302 family)
MPTTAKHKNDLEQFIYKNCYEGIFKEISGFLSKHPNCLNLEFCRVKFPNSVILQSLELEFTSNVTINEDTLSFTAVFSASLLLEEENYQGGVTTAESEQWLRVNCSVVIEDKVKDITVHSVAPFSSKIVNTTDGVAATKNIVPVIPKTEFENEATRFLERYYPQALVEPMSVPIEEILKQGMGLTLLNGTRISKDFSIFGQICFSKGKVDVYDALWDKFDTDVERGTVLIDVATFWRCNTGCLRNTIAHEAYHWHRHRLYAAVKSILRGEKLVAYRCQKSDEQVADEEWTDERMMEWQATGIAPRILMPIQTFKPKVDELLAKYDYYNSTSEKTEILECVIDELAEFYQVSRQSAKIRMTELGYKQAEAVYNYDDMTHTPYFSKISPENAFYEYCNNEGFRKALDTGHFCYVDECFVINNEKFVTETDTGKKLTEYAESNLSECTIQFTYKRIDVSETRYSFHSALYNSNKKRFLQVPSCDNDKNTSLISKAEATANQEQYQFEKKYLKYENKTFHEIMKEIFDEKGIDKKIFADLTGLSDKTFDRVTGKDKKKDGSYYNPELETLLCIFVVMDFSEEFRNRIMSLAGLAWQPIELHKCIRFILSQNKYNTVPEFYDAVNNLYNCKAVNKPKSDATSQ